MGLAQQAGHWWEECKTRRVRERCHPGPTHLDRRRGKGRGSRKGRHRAAADQEATDRLRKAQRQRPPTARGVVTGLALPTTRVTASGASCGGPGAVGPHGEGAGGPCQAEGTVTDKRAPTGGEGTTLAAGGLTGYCRQRARGPTRGGNCRGAAGEVPPRRASARAAALTCPAGRGWRRLLGGPGGARAEAKPGRPEAGRTHMSPARSAAPRDTGAAAAARDGLGAASGPRAPLRSLQNGGDERAPGRGLARARALLGGPG